VCKTPSLQIITWLKLAQTYRKYITVKDYFPAVHYLSQVAQCFSIFDYALFQLRVTPCWQCTTYHGGNSSLNYFSHTHVDNRL